MHRVLVLIMAAIQTLWALTILASATFDRYTRLDDFEIMGLIFLVAVGLTAFSFAARTGKRPDQTLIGIWIDSKKAELKVKTKDHQSRLD